MAVLGVGGCGLGMKSELFPCNPQARPLLSLGLSKERCVFYFWRFGRLLPQCPGRLLFYCLCWMGDKHFPPPAAKVAPPETTAGGGAASSAPSPTHSAPLPGISVPRALLADPAHLVRLPHLTAMEMDTQRGETTRQCRPVSFPSIQPCRISLWRKSVGKARPGGDKGRQRSQGAAKTWLLPGCGVTSLWAEWAVSLSFDSPSSWVSALHPLCWRYSAQ